MDVVWRHGRRLVWPVLLATCLLTTPAARARLACSCIETPSPCRALGFADAVFVGEILGITSTTWQIGTIDREARLVRFRVLEMLSGEMRQEADVVTGLDDADCGYQFDPTRRYIVYAHRRLDQRLSTTICSRTRPLERADEDLKFFHATPRSEATLARVWGTVRLREGELNAGEDYKPFDAARVVLTDGSQSYSAATGRDGGFLIRVPSGTYRADAHVPGGFYPLAPVAPIVIRDPRGCTTFDVDVRYDGHIRGRVVTWTGTPVSHLPLEIGPPEGVAGSKHWSAIYAVTDETGSYDVGRVPPGRFLITVPSVPRVLLPGTTEISAATVVAMTPSARIDTADFVLPQSVRLVSVPGEVVDADGRPRGGASVYLKLPTETFWTPSSPLQTDSQGRFRFSAVEGQRYVLYALDTPVGTQLYSERIEIVATADRKPVTLQLRVR